MKSTLNKHRANRLNLQKITIASLNTVDSELIRGGDLTEDKISITTTSTGTTKSGYMNSNCNDLVTKPKKVIDFQILP